MEKSFRASIPRLWNKLPDPINLKKVNKYFVRILKPTYLK